MRVMDVSELRKRILRALDDARKEAVARRSEVDEAAKAYESFLTAIAVPLMRQAAAVLNANGGATFTVHTPARSVRLASESSNQTFVEFELDAKGPQSQVVGRVSVARGRDALVEERPIVAGKPVAALTEEDVSSFLVKEIPKLVLRP